MDTSCCTCPQYLSTPFPSRQCDPWGDNATKTKRLSNSSQETKRQLTVAGCSLWQRQQLQQAIDNRQAKGKLWTATTQMLHDASQMQMRHAPSRRRQQTGAETIHVACCLLHVARCTMTLRRRNTRIPIARKKVATSYQARQLVICANCQNNVVKHLESSPLILPHAPYSLMPHAPCQSESRAMSN